MPSRLRSSASIAQSLGRLIAAASLAIAAPSMAASPAPAPATPVPANVVLERAVTADDGVSYSGTMTSVVYGRDRIDSTVVRIDHRAPASWRIWYVAPMDAYGRLILSDEKVTYQYEASTNTVYADDWSASAPPLAESINATRVERNYRIENGAATTVAGRTARTLTLTSKYSGALVERLWVDDKTDLVLRRETYHPAGSIESKTSFDNIRFVNTLPKELFDLSIPPGMRLMPGATIGKAATDAASVASALPFKIARPESLPDGFTLDHESLGSHDGIQTLQMVYDDGLRDFSLFENANRSIPTFEGTEPKPIAVGSAQGESAEFGGENLVTWIAGNLNLTLVGDLSAKELAAVGASIKV